MTVQPQVARKRGASEVAAMPLGARTGVQLASTALVFETPLMANEHKGETATGALPPVVRLLAEADKLLPEEASRPREARKGLGLACKATAKAMAKNGAQVAVSGVVSADLAVHFTLVETIDRVIEDVETLLAVVKQANFLPDAKAIEQLRKVNQQVNAQGAFDANRFERFSALAGILGGGSAGDIRRLARPS